MQEQYLDQVCSYIRFREARPQVRLELATHYDDIVQECLATGMNDLDANRTAAQRLGDPQNLGKALDRAHRPQFEWSLALLSIALVIFGLIVLYNVQYSGILIDGEAVFSKTLMFTLGGIVLVTGLILFDYYRIYSYAFPAFWVILAITLFSVSYDDSGRQALAFGPLLIDFISISPFLLIICAAGIFSRPDWSWSTRNYILTLLLLALPDIFYLLSDSSIPPVILYTGTFIVLVWYSRAGWKKVIGLGSVIVLPLLAGLMEPYRMERLSGFWHPESDAEGYGYIYLQFQQAFQDATWLGQGTVTPGAIPEGHIASIFVYVVSCFGWLAGIILVGLALLLIIQLWRAAHKIEEPFGRLLIIGTASLMLIQFAWSILMTLGVLPVFQIYMPFISYGGVPFLMQMFLLGMVMSVYRRKNLERSLNLSIAPDKQQPSSS